jgi:hypothetical protein
VAASWYLQLAAASIVLLRITDTGAVLNLRKSNVVSIQYKKNRQINAVETTYADDTFCYYVPGIKIPRIEDIPDSCRNGCLYPAGKKSNVGPGNSE